MKRTKRLFIPVVLGVVLIAAVVGVASARPDARPLAQPWRVLTVPPHTCNPRVEDIDYNYYQGYLECNTATCAFVCPLDFPAAGEQAVGAVNVKRVTAYVLDNDGTASHVRVYFRKIYPVTGGALNMADFQSTESTDDPQVVMDTSIDNNPVYRSQAPYVWVVLNAVGHHAYGFYIHYTW
jgi:hypothetical protein